MVRDNFWVVGQIGLFSRAQIASMRDRTKRRNYSEEAEEFRRDHARRRRYGLAQRHAQKLTHLYGSLAKAEAAIRRENEEARAARSRARGAAPTSCDPAGPEPLATATTRRTSVAQESGKSAQVKSEYAATEASRSTLTGSAQPRPKPDGPAQPRPAQRRPNQARPNPDGLTQAAPEVNGSEHATQCEQTEPEQTEPEASPHKQIGFEPLERALAETEPTGIDPGEEALTESKSTGIEPVEHALTKSKPTGPERGRNPASPSGQSDPDRIWNRSGNADRRQQRRLRPGSTKRHPGAARTSVHRPESARHARPEKGTGSSNSQVRRNSDRSGLGAAHQRSRKPLPAYLGREISPRPEGCREHVPP
jgi:hypothetical protein